MNIKLFKQKDFSIYISGKLISLLGSNVLQFALSLYIYAITGSAALFSTVISIAILPRFLLAPFAGVFGDWFDRKKMIVSLDLINGLIMLLSAYIFFVQEGFSVSVIFILVVIFEIIEIFYESSSSGILPSIIKKEDMAQAQSFMSLVFGLARLASPMVGAFLYGAFGLFIVIVLNGISFIIAAFFEHFMTVPKHHKRPEKIDFKSFFVDFKEGLSVIKNNRFIRSIISIGIVINFVLSPIFSVGILVLMIDVLNRTEFQYGLFQSSTMIAMIVGPVIVGMFLAKKDIAKVCFIHILLASMVLVVMGLIFEHSIFSHFNSLVTPFILMLILGFFLGYFISVVNISVGTLFNQIVPLNLMGRTSTVMNLLITIAIPIGQVSFGVLFDRVDPFYILSLSGMFLVISTLLVRKSLLASTQEETKEAIMNNPLKEVIEHGV